jgi:tubulin-specific chaperone E
VVLDSALIRYSNLFSEIQNTCPRITSLDLSRNLFSSLSNVAEICQPLKELRTLRLTGNRFWDISLEGQLVDAFVNVEWLALNMCALRWDEVPLFEIWFC